MALEIAWKQNILVTDSYLLKLLLVVFGFVSQAFVCEFSRQNICSVIHIWFKLAGWYESPIKSVVVTFPLDKIVFPTVTLCPRDSRPDRWGFAIKIFDHLNTDCESKRWDYVFNYRKKTPFRAILREFYFIIINLWLSICDPNCLLIQYH